MRFPKNASFAVVCVWLASNCAGQKPAGPPVEPPMLGIHWQHGVDRPKGVSQGASGGTKNSPCSDCMTYHGGRVLPTTRVLPIFWGTSWNKASFVQDKITGIDNWYTNYPGSDYEIGTMSEYCSGTGMTGSLTCSGANPLWIETPANNGASGVSYHSGDYQVDQTKASSGSKTANILNEVCREIQAKVTANPNTFSPGANDYYPVYVDLPISGGFCAYHSYGTCSYKNSGGTSSSVSIQFGFFWNADGNAGCAAGDGPFTAPEPSAQNPTYQGSVLTGHSEGLASLIDSTVHELSETRTDPGSPTAWIDSGGQEDGDKCEWNTGYPGQNLSSGVPVVSFGDGTKWVMQPEWSNKAAMSNGLIYGEQSRSRKGTATGSYGCVYGTRAPLWE